MHSNAQTSLRGPLGENPAPLGASGGNGGRGVSTKKSNLDFSGLRIVRKGNTVRQGALIGYVSCVRMGNACVDWVGGAKGNWNECRWLRVVAV